MLRLRSLLLGLALVLILGSVSAEVIDFQTCPDSVDTCTIQQVRVTPCPEAVQHAACNIRRRRTTQMSFDFTPH
uniref:Uncharacterized protein LOC108045604 n=1 Tax=Drosophila rhopaloa TaxID=1041015 RepID=A0A6P4EQT7_DRORH